MKTAAASMALVASRGARAFFEEERCDLTADNGSGPFYPTETLQAVEDLTRVGGRPGKAEGQVLYVFGKVLDEKCKPVPGVRIEIWQADRQGNYKHPESTSDAALDPHFRYFGYLTTAADGSYLFKTISPAPYEFRGLRRAPHIHFKVKSQAHHTLTSEMYFHGDEKLMADDRVFLFIPRDKRPALIAPKQDPSMHGDLGVDFEKDALCCPFNLVVGTLAGQKKS